MQKKGLARVLLLALVFNLVAFIAVARAEAPFAFTELVLHEENGTDTVLTPDSVLDRSIRTLFVRFNHGLDMAQNYSQFLTLKDSSGAPAPYGPGAADNMLYLTFQSALKEGETYTLTVKGGPEGLKDRDGNTLAQDLTFRFRTTGRPVENTLTVGAMDEVTNPLQANAYKVTAKAGPLKLKAAAGPEQLFHVLVMTARPLTLEEPGPRILFDGLLHDKRPDATVNLPVDGQYVVVLTRVTADGKRGHGEPFWMTALNLTAPNLYVPPILLREMAPGEVMAEPFAVQAGILHGAPAKFLKLKLDDTMLSENLLNADGSAQPYTINPAELKEGLHQLEAIAQGPQSEHAGVAARSFVVDRLDSFADVPRSHWARTPVEVLSDRGTLSGRAPGRFDPEQPVTRAEFAKMLAMVLSLKAPAAGAPEFADVAADAWSRPYIQALAASGLVKGETVGSAAYYYPQRTITRAEAATIIGRSLGFSNQWVSAGDATFSDFSRVPDWAKPSVVLLSRMKWISGFPDGTYRPDGTLTRAQAAKILVKYLGM